MGVTCTVPACCVDGRRKRKMGDVSTPRPLLASPVPPVPVSSSSADSPAPVVRRTLTEVVSTAGAGVPTTIAGAKAPDDLREASGPVAVAVGAGRAYPTGDEADDDEADAPPSATDELLAGCSVLGLAELEGGASLLKLGVPAALARSPEFGAESGCLDAVCKSAAVAGERAGARGWCMSRCEPRPEPPASSSSCTVTPRP